MNALEITKEIGDTKGEASVYANLGTVFQTLGDFVKAGEYMKKSIAIHNETGDREGKTSA